MEVGKPESVKFNTTQTNTNTHTNTSNKNMALATNNRDKVTSSVKDVVRRSPFLKLLDQKMQNLHGILQGLVT